MWAGNQASRLIGRKTEAVRQEKRSCALNSNVFIHPPTLIMFAARSAWFIHHSLLGAFLRCLLRSVFAFLNLLRFWFVCLLDYSGGDCFWVCVKVCEAMRVYSSVLFVFCMYALFHKLVCVETAMRPILVSEYFGLIGQRGSCILKRRVFWSTPIPN